MEANEIKKALECCRYGGRCDECPCFDDIPNCQALANNNAIALINSQEQRIKELTEEKRNLEYILEGVMHSVDKWLDGAELEQDEVNRAATMREKTLQIVEKLTEEKDNLRTLNRLHEQDVEDWRKLAESKAEEIYPEFMRDYKAMLEEMEGLYAELEELRKERDAIEADTVRKMQERLTLEFDRMHKSNFMTPEVRQWIINQIAKEMLEGNDGKG